MLAGHPLPGNATPPTGTRTGAGRQGNFWIIFRYPDFRYLWIGNFFAIGAQWIQILTVGWLVLHLTDGNAFLTGTAVGIRTLPFLVIGPWAGVLADRIDRRKLVMVTQIYMAIAAIVFAFFGIGHGPGRPAGNRPTQMVACIHLHGRLGDRPLHRPPSKASDGPQHRAP